MLVAIQDYGSSWSHWAKPELTMLGPGETIRRWYRGTLALAGYAGNNITRPSWVKLVQNRRGEGPSVIETKIPIGEQAGGGGMKPDATSPPKGAFYSNWMTCLSLLTRGRAGPH